MYVRSVAKQRCVRTAQFGDLQESAWILDFVKHLKAKMDVHYADWFVLCRQHSVVPLKGHVGQCCIRNCSLFDFEIQTKRINTGCSQNTRFFHVLKCQLFTNIVWRCIKVTILFVFCVHLKKKCFNLGCLTLKVLRRQF